MNNLKIKDFDNLEKDPNSGAILISSGNNSALEIRVSNLMRKVKHIEAQNEEIIQLLKDYFNKLNA